MIRSRDIAAVMVTVDRSPQRNYLLTTLDNIRKSRKSSARLHSLTLFDSHTGFASRHAIGLDGDLRVVQSARRLCGSMNVATALYMGAASSPDNVKWVLFLEDDIDVCADFFDGVGAWLDDYGDSEHLVYPLAAGYRWVDAAVKSGESAHVYPVRQFYGTQAFVMRIDDALNLSSYIADDPYRKNDEGVSWDLMMHDWATKHGASHFLTPCPSFVQHIGRESTVNPRPKTHQFASWPGREWSYRSVGKSAVSEAVVFDGVTVVPV